MAVKGKPIISYRCNLLFFLHVISIDKRPAMGSQPNLASRSQVVSTYKCSQNFGTLPQICGTKTTSNFWQFFATSSLDTTYLRNECHTDKPKC